MDVAQELWAWASTLPDWQQALVRRLLVQPSQTPEERAECIQKLLARLGGKFVDYGPALSQQDFPQEKTKPAPRLVKLGGLRGVNAIDTGGEIQFEPDGLTIVYGPNAAGKTGYVRALKRLCRTVDRDTTILPNVFDQAQGAAPRARVELLHEGRTVALQWNLEATEPTPLASATVFDARCAHFYLVDENTIAFVPLALGVFDRLVNEQMALRHEIESSIAVLEATKPQFPEFTRDTRVKSFLDSLSVRTVPEEARALAMLDEEEKERLRQLRLAVASAGADTEARISRLKTELHEAERLDSDLGRAFELLGGAMAERLGRLAEEAASAREASALAAREAFAAEPAAGVGSEPWRMLWEAARTFWLSENRERGEFPPTEEGDACPLCLQTLDLEARSRFVRFEQWVKAMTGKREQAAASALAEALRPIGTELLDCCRTPFVGGLEERDAGLYERLMGWRAQAEARIQALREIDRSGGAPPPDLGEPPRDQVTALVARTRREMETLEASHDPQKLETLRSELAEFEDRERLGTRTADVTAWIGKLGEIALAKKAFSALHTRAISIKQRELTDELMTTALRAQLEHELDGLDLGHISINLESRGRQGSTLVQLKLAQAGDAHLDAILSEGEKHSLALAFFFAECAVNGNDAGVIFDDPVTSLDHERRDCIAERVVLESKARQVIVFTHDLAFLFYVERMAKAEKVPYRIQSIWRAGDMVGRTDSDAPWEAMSSERRIKWLKDKLQNLPRPQQAASADDYRQQVIAWYEHLRKTWERVVEEKLLGGVVQRWVPDVQTKRLKDVALTGERVERVEAAITRASDFVHDEPSAGNKRLPSKEDMSRDLDEIESFVKELKQ